MNSHFPTEIFGCPLGAFVGIGAFWTVIIYPIFEENTIGIGLIIGLSILTAWLWGLYGWLILAFVGGALLIGFIICLIVKSDIDFEGFVKVALVLLGIGCCCVGIYFLINNAKLSGILDFIGIWALKILAGICVLALIAFLTLIAIEVSKKKGGGNPPPPPPPPPPPQPNKKGVFYHGTSTEAAEDIWNTNYWKSDMEPAMLWMSDYPDYAINLAKDRYGSDSRLLVLYVEPGVDLTDQKNGTYYIEMDNSNTNKLYYEVQGVHVSKMLDLDMNILEMR